LAAGSISSIGLKRATNWKHSFCKLRELNITVEKANIRVLEFKKGGKLSKSEKWRLGTEEIEVTNKVKYLEVILDSREKSGKERKQASIRRKLSLNTINVCLARALNTEVKVLGQLCTSLIESRIMVWVKIWGLEDGQKEAGEMHELFCRRLMEVPLISANGGV
jgi:hypothetical protein